MKRSNQKRMWYSEGVDLKTHVKTIDFAYALLHFKHHLNEEKEIYIAGCRIFKIRIRNDFKIYYLGGIPIWQAKREHKFLKLFLESIITQYPSYKNYYIFLSRSGEFFLLMHHMKELMGKDSFADSLFVFVAAYHQNICHMFFPQANTILVKTLNVSWISREVEAPRFRFEDKSICIPMYEKYFTDVEEKIRNQHAHYYDLLKQHLQLHAPRSRYAISPAVQEKAASLAHGLLKDNFIIVCPESLSNEAINKSFWIKLCRELQKQGYEIFCNVMTFYNLIPGTNSVFLTYEEAIGLAKYAKAIIGLRSGFLECLSQVNVPVVALYTDLPSRGVFEPVWAADVKSGFSIKKIPYVNPTNIFEFVYDDAKQEKMINQICKIFNKN